MVATKTIVREHEADLVVEAADTVADGVVALRLADPTGAPLPAWTPGAHVDLILGELTRQYSLCSSPGRPNSWRVGVLRTPDSRGGSDRVHTSLPIGATVRVRGPRNHFPLVSSPRYLFIAGGIGITPMLPMIAEAEAAGADWSLLYGGRERASMAFLDELARYGDKVTVAPQNETGMLDLAAVLGSPRPGTLVYCCGPEGLLGAVEKFCEDWPPGALHLERFSAKPQDAAEGGESSFELVLERSGHTLQVSARPVRARRHPRGRGERARLVPGGGLRDLRDRGHRRRCRPSRLGAERGGTRLQRVHDGLRLPLPVRPAHSRSLIYPTMTPTKRCGRTYPA